MQHKYQPSPYFDIGTGLTIHFNGDRTFHDANNSQVRDVFKQLEGVCKATGSANSISKISRSQVTASVKNVQVTCCLESNASRKWVRKFQIVHRNQRNQVISEKANEIQS